MSLNANILIVEDDIFIADYIEDMLQDAQYNNIKKAHAYNDAVELIKCNNPEVIFLDINLNDSKTGIDLSNLKINDASVIFITGQNDEVTVKNALETEPHAYLTKPVKKTDVLASLQLAISKKQTQTFSFKDGYDVVYLDYSNILYFKADGNYVHVFTADKKHTIRQTLAEVMKNLPNSIFQQTHRSYIVNLNKVTRKSNSKIFLNDIELPISRKFDKVFKNTD